MADAVIMNDLDATIEWELARIEFSGGVATAVWVSTDGRHTVDCELDPIMRRGFLPPSVWQAHRDLEDGRLDGQYDESFARMGYAARTTDEA